MAKNNIDDLVKKHLEQKKLIEEAEAGISSMLKKYADIAQQQKEINYLTEQNNKLITEKQKAEADVAKSEAKYRAARIKGDAKLLAIAEKELLINKKILNNKENAIAANQEIITQSEEHLNNEREAVEVASTRVAVVKSIGKATTKLVELGKKNLSYYYKQSKSVKDTQLSMGILTKNSLSFSNNLSSAALKTNILGSNVSDLAEMQSTYSDELGTATQLTEAGLIAMSKLSQGTGLANQSAAELAASMGRFNINAEDSASIIEGVLGDSKKLGVNGLKVTKAVSKNLKLANKYGFKNGIKGLAKLTAEAERLGVELNDIAGVAEQLFNPEGAIDMAAKLQVLGGEWSKIADPFKLMYQARNDMDGLTKSIASAAKGSFNLNQQTGEFESSALEMHRLREVAKATGMEYDNLAEMAKKAAKLSEIESKIGASIDPEYSKYLSSVALFDGKKKEFYVNIDGSKTFLKDLTRDNKLLETQIKALKESNVKLEENAKASKTFDKTWENFKNTMKTLLLPAFEGFTNGLTSAVDGFNTFLLDSGFVGGIKDLTEGLGKWFTDNPIKTALGALVAGLASKATWLANGFLLAKGFNAGASVGGSTLTNPTGGGKFGRGRNLSIGKSLGNGLKGGGALGILGAVGGIGRNLMDDPDSDLGKSVGVASNAATMAATGAMIGSIIPGIGTAIGAAIGGIGGLGYGLYDEFYNNKNKGLNTQSGPVHQDFVMRPGQPAASFTAKDTLIGLKDGGPIEKSFGGINNNGKSSKVEFGDLNINFGTIRIEGDAGVNNIDLANDPMFIREITRNIQDMLRKNIGGGKSNPNLLV